MFEVTRNETDLSVNTDNFAKQILHIDCTDQSLNEPNLNMRKCSVQDNNKFKGFIPRRIFDKQEGRFAGKCSENDNTLKA